MGKPPGSLSTARVVSWSTTAGSRPSKFQGILAIRGGNDASEFKSTRENFGRYVCLQRGSVVPLPGRWPGAGHRWAALACRYRACTSHVDSDTHVNAAEAATSTPSPRRTALRRPRVLRQRPTPTPQQATATSMSTGPTATPVPALTPAANKAPRAPQSVQRGQISLLVTPSSPAVRTARRSTPSRPTRRLWLISTHRANAVGKRPVPGGWPYWRTRRPA